MKTCTKCGVEKPLDEFGVEKRKRDGRTAQCLPCRRKLSNAQYKKNPEGPWAGYLRRAYGITVADYDRMLADQGGKCGNPACPSTTPGKGKERWCVDHNHTTGEVRGLLCHGCNTAAGLAQDHPDVLRGLADYLEDRGYYG